LADCFGIHRLQMEDVVNVYQRPKVEDYKDHLFLISRVMREKDMQLINDQLSLFVGRNFVITLQDKYEDILDPVRDRIRHGKGFVRRYGADYLGYALMDVVLDNYYPILEQLGERLDELQDLLIMNPTRDALNKVLQIKRELIVLRRSIWSERDKINDILRSAFPNVTDTTKVFFRDSYDHCIQILDLVESYKEVTASLMDVYHSSVSNRLNQVMKVLTIISTIFIPLTFIVGLYGMNFAHLNPKTGEPLPLNMPELYSPYGYLSVCIAMVLIVIGQIYFFYKKGWLTKG
ncbi:MAG TPA: magnesium/cobalt transporter CorA, partial [Bacteroidia bacterium]|nr:magnesium/cobalt transporter CorA [Bacteroidia bacterium]